MCLSSFQGRERDDLTNWCSSRRPKQPQTHRKLRNNTFTAVRNHSKLQSSSAAAWKSTSNFTRKQMQRDSSLKKMIPNRFTWYFTQMMFSVKIPLQSLLFVVTAGVTEHLHQVWLYQQTCVKLIFHSCTLARVSRAGPQQTTSAELFVFFLVRLWSILPGRSCSRISLCQAFHCCCPGGETLLPAPTSAPFPTFKEAPWRARSSGCWPGLRFSLFLEPLNRNGISDVLQDAPAPRRPSSASGLHRSRGPYPMRSTHCELLTLFLDYLLSKAQSSWSCRPEGGGQRAPADGAPGVSGTDRFLSCPTYTLICVFPPTGAWWTDRFLKSQRGCLPSCPPCSCCKSCFVTWQCHWLAADQ